MTAKDAKVEHLQEPAVASIEDQPGAAQEQPPGRYPKRQEQCEDDQKPGRGSQPFVRIRGTNVLRQRGHQVVSEEDGKGRQKDQGDDSRAARRRTVQDLVLPFGFRPLRVHDDGPPAHNYSTARAASLFHGTVRISSCFLA